MTDIVIKNSKLVLSDKIFKGGIVIKGGKITDIKRDSELPSGKALNAMGNYIIPGLIDVHVHLREPGACSKEDWSTGSMAAAAGGVTTVLDMPNNRPSTTTTELLEKKRRIAESKSIVDYGFHFGASMDNIGELKKIKDIASVKFYMSSTTGNLLIGNYDVFLEELRVLAGRNLLSTVHAEDNKMVEYWTDKLMKTGRTDPMVYAESRPEVCAVEAAGKAISLSRVAGARLHLCHISTKKEVELLEINKKILLRKILTRNTSYHDKNIQPLTAEATPHHLFLTKRDMKKLGNFAKTNPPLRSRRDQNALWEGIRDGIIDIIATDHAPHLPESKKIDVWNSSAGVPGLETMLPLLLNEVNNGNLRINKLVHLTSENPARIFGINNKGKIERGYDADLVIIDLKKETEIRNEKLFTKCRWSPFNGWRLRGSVLKTIVRGNVVFDEGNINRIKGSEIQYKAFSNNSG